MDVCDIRAKNPHGNENAFVERPRVSLQLSVPSANVPDRTARTKNTYVPRGSAPVHCRTMTSALTEIGEPSGMPPATAWNDAGLAMLPRTMAPLLVRNSMVTP